MKIDIWRFQRFIFQKCNYLISNAWYKILFYIIHDWIGMWRISNFAIWSVKLRARTLRDVVSIIGSRDIVVSTYFIEQ